MVEQEAGCSTGQLLTVLDEPATGPAATSLRQMSTRRLEGEPLQYVMGRWSFRTLELHVDRRVLIPRPETELLAESALEECDRLGAERVVDLGTGSGAIALSLAVERPGLEVWATDAAGDALAVTRANLAGLGRTAARVHLAEGSWFEALPDDLRGRCDVIVSNPPYVAAEEWADLPPEVRAWEPEAALLSANHGLADITAILAEAPGWLARPGAVLLEMAPHQAGEVEHLARDAGFTAVSVWPDLAGRDRILRARL